MGVKIGVTTLAVLGRDVRILTAPVDCDEGVKILVTVHSHPYDRGDIVYAVMNLNI